ncbi:MAG: CHAT domain-containing protein [Cyanobacteriota bacterium SKYGB_h_bin112]|nr:CHAT domain-containing protein [Cyanobacteriota bacterium SKYGB_h_bin112]
MVLYNRGHYHRPVHLQLAQGHNTMRQRAQFRRFLTILLAIAAGLVVAVSGHSLRTEPVPRFHNLTSRASNPADNSWLIADSQFQVPTLSNHQQSTPNEGRALYEAGRYADALQVWQHQLRAFTIQGDRRNRALTLGYLALTYGQLGQWDKANEAIATSLNLVQQLPNNSTTSLAWAQLLMIQGHLQLHQSHADTALATWQQAQNIYQAIGATSQVIQAEINQANALQAMGLYARAHQTLKATAKKLETQPDSALKAMGFLHLGNALRLIRVLDSSQEALTESLAIADRIGASNERQLALLQLGNTARAQRQTTAALRYYRQVTCPSITPSTINLSTQEETIDCAVKLQAQLNQLRLLLDLEQLDQASSLLPELHSYLAAIPVSEFAIYAKIDFAESLTRYWSLRATQAKTPVTKPAAPTDTRLQPEKYQLDDVPSDKILEIARMFASASQQAKQIRNPRAESYALGRLGGLYEASQQWAEAIDLTQQALVLAQGLNIPGTLYQWQWQLGRLLVKMGDYGRAIAAYQEAVNTLDAISSDLTAINPDVQLSFREGVEPVYRELMSLLLPVDKPVDQSKLAQARQLIEALQLAELKNYFREACLDLQPKPVETIDKGAAIIYPILLPDRLEVLLSLPDQSLHRHTTKLPRTEIEATIADMQRSLRRNSFLNERLPLAKRVYGWLIKPFEAELSGIETIVFLLDGSLRNLPMAALHSEDHYLIEDYRIALTPSLSLLRPSPLNEGGLRVLKAGISQATEGFLPLPGVETEIATIAPNLPSVTLLNQDFTAERLEQQLKSAPFPVIHLATHGQFSSNPNETFILAWNQRISLSKLEEILKILEYRPTPIELLILSACQTAAGDDRASLGLAGVAVRSGARSTLATLWAVEDQSTADLMIEFYRQVTQPGITRAEALRRAQLKLLRGNYEHPYFWAPFVLVGNWL